MLNRNRRTAHMRSRFTNAVLLALAVVALWFLNSFAFQYLTVDRDRYGIYWARQEWLYVHIVAGGLALLLGPLQFWLGLNRREIFVHRIIGAAYVLCVLVSASAGLYLAQQTAFRWILGMGLTAMALEWFVLSSLHSLPVFQTQLKQQNRSALMKLARSTHRYLVHSGIGTRSPAFYPLS